MKNTRFFLMTILTGLLFVACSDDDDDQPVIPGVSVSTTQDTFGEGDGTVTVTFSTTETFSTDVVLTYEVTGSATAGEDYVALSGSLTLTAGESSVTQNLVLTDDDEVEANEGITITLTTVDGGTDFIASDRSVTLTLTDNDSFAFENGILVVHEGNFTQGNASVSFVSEDLSQVQNGIYKSVNEVDAWGDTAQSMAFNDSFGYIVLNGSKRIEVVDRYTFESVATIGADDGDFENPRYMVIVNDKGYVTDWGDGGNPDDDFVAVINLETNTVESTISVPDGPERIVAVANTLYVGHEGRTRPNNIVSVIDATTNTLSNPITVGDRPSSMQLIDGSLWVLSGGNPPWIPSVFPDLEETAGQLDRINTITNTVEATFEFTQTEHPNYLSIDGDTLYYYLAGNIFEFNISDTSLSSSPVIEGVSFYDMTVSEGRLFGVDAKNFSVNGSLEVYNLSDNSLIQSLEVGIIPGEVYFNGMAER